MGRPDARRRRAATRSVGNRRQRRAGQSGNTLYDGWNDSGATNAALALNATEWLST
ncbi:hypothetical protein ACIHIX_37310 [Streptomyces sp. NPDC051913]|uniref:hypothetical protein n=1 Tax=Streptomyces sp. NPDC051913 TaxID=3365676 RepID=UPI0037D8EBF0